VQRGEFFLGAFSGISGLVIQVKSGEGMGWWMPGEWLVDARGMA